MRSGKGVNWFLPSYSPSPGRDRPEAWSWERAAPKRSGTLGWAQGPDREPVLPSAWVGPDSRLNWRSVRVRWPWAEQDPV